MKQHSPHRVRERLVPFDEALAMIDRGEIHDAMSQLGLVAAARIERV